MERTFFVCNHEHCPPDGGPIALFGVCKINCGTTCRLVTARSIAIRRVASIKLAQQPGPDQFPADSLRHDFCLRGNSVQYRLCDLNQLCPTGLSHQLNLTRAFEVVHCEK